MKLIDDKLKKVKCDLQRQQNMFAVMTQTNEVAVEQVLLYNSHYEIKPFMGCECVKEVYVLCSKKQQLFKNISPSANKMVADVNGLTGDFTAST